jgi:outer membrane lipoprotein-sorting protein
MGLGTALALVSTLLAACATGRPPASPAITAEAADAQVALERRWQAFGDLRTYASLRIRRGDRVQQLSGPLLLRSPSSLRFEALTPFGPPFLVVGSDPDTVMIWEVLQGRAFKLAPSPEATVRWLGLPLGTEDLVALLSGHVRAMREPQEGMMLPADSLGPSLVLIGGAGRQRIWLDPATGQAFQVEWTQSKTPARVAFRVGSATTPPTALDLSTLDGRLEVAVRYRDPVVDSGFDPGLLRVTLPEGVKIQDFR